MYITKKNGVVGFKGRGNGVLNELISENMPLFKTSLACMDELGRPDKLGAMLKCRALAAQESVTIDDVEDIVSKCLTYRCEGGDLEKVFFQYIPIVIINELTNYINKSNLPEMELAEYLYDKIISLNGANVSHFMIGLNSSKGELNV